MVIKKLKLAFETGIKKLYLGGFYNIQGREEDMAKHTSALKASCVTTIYILLVRASHKVMSNFRLNREDHSYHGA